MDHIDDLGQERFRLIKGTKISIYIEDDNYECTIIAHDPNKRGSRSQFVYTIQYVGSDETETLDLSKHDFKIIGMPPESQRKTLVISKVHKQKKFLLVDSSAISVGDTNLVAGASTKKLVSKRIHTTRKKVFPTDKPDRHANKVVDVVEIVLNSKVPLSTLRESPRDAIKEIVRKEADITYGNSYWTNIKSLLHMAIDAKEKGEKVDHAWLVRMHRDYAPSDLIDGRLVPRDPAAAATAAAKRAAKASSASAKSDAKQPPVKKEKATAEQPAVKATENDALRYLDQVKVTFSDRPKVFKSFLKVLNGVKSNEIDPMEVSQRVQQLFNGYNHLILGFNPFVPERYRIREGDLEEKEEPTPAASPGEETKSSREKRNSARVSKDIGTESKMPASGSGDRRKSSRTRDNTTEEAHDDAIVNDDVEMNGTTTQYKIVDPNTSLVSSIEKHLVTPYTYFTIQQLRPCNLGTAGGGAANSSRYAFDWGFPGLECVHCTGEAGSRRFFWKSAEVLNCNWAKIPDHTLKCSSCPQEVKQKLKLLKQDHKLQSQALPRGSQKEFFNSVWERLHGNDAPPRTSRTSVGGRPAVTAAATNNNTAATTTTTTTAVRSSRRPTKSRSSMQNDRAPARTEAKNEPEVPAYDANDTNADIIRKPHPHDVLAGRGSMIFNHPGNGRFRELIENHRREYVDPKTTRNEKAAINARIVSIIRCLKPAGRFLEEDLQTSCWTEIGDRRAKEKASKALRENRTPIKDEVSQPPLKNPIAGTEILHPEDKGLVPDYIYLLIEQMEPCGFVKDDDKGRTGALERDVGFPGLACKHCKGYDSDGYARSGRYFPTSKETMGNSGGTKNMMNHMTNCEKCPLSIRMQLENMSSPDYRKVRNETTLTVLFCCVVNS